MMPRVRNRPTEYGRQTCRDIRANLVVPAAEKWSRERWIKHWEKIIRNPEAGVFAHECAEQALVNLGARKDQTNVDDELALMEERMRSFDRVPGEDDA